MRFQHHGQPGHRRIQCADGDECEQRFHGQRRHRQLLQPGLHHIIRGHTAYPYFGSGTNAWTILELAQENPANPNQIIDVYRNRAYATVTDRAGGSSSITYNREHTWPNS